MVELMVPRESKTAKFKRDAKKILGLRKQAMVELKADGLWNGSPKARMLTLINWYQEQNNCRVCRDTPEQSFSVQVRKATERNGVVAGLAKFGRLWTYRTLHSA